MAFKPMVFDRYVLADTAAADSLKVLDPKRPIREADMLSGAMVQVGRATRRALVA